MTYITLHDLHTVHTFHTYKVSTSLSVNPCNKSEEDIMKDSPAFTSGSVAWRPVNKGASLLTA